MNCYFCQTLLLDMDKSSEYNYVCPKCSGPHISVIMSAHSQYIEQLIYVHIYCYIDDGPNYHLRINLVKNDATLCIDMRDEHIHVFDTIPNITPKNFEAKLKTILTFL